MSAPVAANDNGRLRALDLFCGAGGAGMGLHRAGYEVVGVDIAPQPNYPFQFHQADAIGFPLGGFDFIWASPPCQRYSLACRNAGTAHLFPDLLPAMRERLRAVSCPWAIENVPGAPMRADALLCGTMFGLRLIRHRLFETSFPIDRLVPPCRHKGDEVPVYGHGTPSWHRERRGGAGIGIELKREAMGIHWMNRDELSQAIPPAYSEFIARAAMRARGVAA